MKGTARRVFGGAISDRLRLFQRIGEAWLKVFRQKGDVGKPFAQSVGKEKSKNRSALYTLNEKVA